MHHHHDRCAAAGPRRRHPPHAAEAAAAARELTDLAARVLREELGPKDRRELAEALARVALRLEPDARCPEAEAERFELAYPDVDPSLEDDDWEPDPASLLGAAPPPVCRSCGGADFVLADWAAPTPAVAYATCRWACAACGAAAVTEHLPPSGPR